MENPSTWGKLEHVINDALQLAHENHRKMIIGLSTVRTIADALRREGLVTDGPELVSLCDDSRVEAVRDEPRELGH